MAKCPALVPHGKPPDVGLARHRPREILDVQARIVMSRAERTDEDLYDTVVGYRGGNWIYEWAKQAMLWQQKASQSKIPS